MGVNRIGKGQTSGSVWQVLPPSFFLCPEDTHKHMTLPSLSRALVAAALLLLVAPAWGGEEEFVDELVASSSTPEASGVAEARTLVREGRYDEALAILRPLARGREVDASVLFQIGMAAVGASHKPGLTDDGGNALLDEAIASFHTMLVDRPGLVRVRL